MSLARGSSSSWRTAPRNQREVIRLKFQNGFSYQEISRISGHSVSNVGYLIHAGIKALRAHLFVGHAAESRFDREENLS